MKCIFFFNLIPNYFLFVQLCPLLSMSFKFLMKTNMEELALLNQLFDCIYPLSN